MKYFIILVLSLHSIKLYGDHPVAPKISDMKEKLTITFPGKSYEFKRATATTDEDGSNFKPIEFFAKANLFMVEEIPYEFGPDYWLLNEKNEIRICEVPRFNSRWDTFVIVENTEAGDGTYGIDVWRLEPSGKWVLKEQYKHSGGPPYFKFVAWEGNDKIKIMADFFNGKQTGPHILPLKEVPHVMRYLKLKRPDQ